MFVRDMRCTGYEPAWIYYSQFSFLGCQLTLKDMRKSFEYSLVKSSSIKVILRNDDFLKKTSNLLNIGSLEG